MKNYISWKKRFHPIIILDSLPKALLLEAKQKGFADRQIAHMIGCWESEVHRNEKNSISTGFLNL